MCGTDRQSDYIMSQTKSNTEINPLPADHDHSGFQSVLLAHLSSVFTHQDSQMFVSN